jgi:hypothetical protein
MAGLEVDAELLQRPRDWHVLAAAATMEGTSLPLHGAQVRGSRSTATRLAGNHCELTGSLLDRAVSDTSVCVGFASVWLCRFVVVSPRGGGVCTVCWRHSVYIRVVGKCSEHEVVPMCLCSCTLALLVCTFSMCLHGKHFVLYLKGVPATAGTRSSRIVVHWRFGLKR